MHRIVNVIYLATFTSIALAVSAVMLALVIGMALIGICEKYVPESFWRRIL